MAILKLIRTCGIVCWLAANNAQAASSFDFTYSGRLTDTDSGKPVEGPVHLKLSFYHQSSGGSPVLSVNSGLNSVALQEGVFQITVSLSPGDYHSIFNDISQPVYVEVTDLTHAAQSYDRQQISMVPFAAKIPVDGTTVKFNDQGELVALAPSAPSGTAPGNLVGLDNSARLPAVDGSQLTNVAATNVGGQSAAVVAAAAAKVSQASSSNSASTIVLRDGNGGFSAGNITAGTLAAASVTATGNVTGAALKLSSGAKTAALVAPAGLAANVAYTLPPTPLAGQVLTTDASGFLSWTTSGAGSGAFVAKAGDTMSGPLVLPADSLAVGSDELVAAGGHIGLGTTAPGYDLSFGAASARILGVDRNSSGTPGAALSMQAGGAASGGSNLNGGSLTLASGIATGSGASSVAIATAGGGGSGTSDLLPTVKMTITGDGNIGIGTTAPAARLDITGAVVSRGMAAPSVSAAGQGLIYFDSGTNRFKLSENGGAFVNLSNAAAGGVTSVTAGTGLSGGAITGSGTLSLANTTVSAGTYTRANITVDAQGRLTAAASSSSSDLTSDVSGTLPVGSGGTGYTSFTTNGVILGNATSNLFSTAAGTANQLLRVPAAGGAPAFGALDLSQSAAVAGTLAVATGGTGAATLTTNGILFGNGSSAIGATAVGSQYQVLQSSGGGSAPSFGALSLTQTAATAGTLPISRGGTGTGAAPANGQLLIGNGSSYTLGTLTAGSGVTVTNAAGTITLATTSDPATKLSKAGDTMSGALSLASNGLVVGTSQLVVTGGNVGINTTSPSSILTVVDPSPAGNFGAGQAASGLVIGNTGNTDAPTSLTIAYGGRINGSNLGWSNALIGVNTYYDTTSDTLKRASISGGFTSAFAIAMSADHFQTGGNRLGLWAGNNADPTERFTLTLDGNVGIGSTSPLGRLDVGTGAICIAGSCRTAWPAAGNLWTASGNDITNINTGNIGIGTTSTFATVEVNGSVAASSGFFALQSGNTCNGIPCYGMGWNGNSATTLQGYNGVSLVSQHGQLFVNQSGQIILGVGDNDTPVDTTIRGANASGSSVPGGNLIFAASNGTGSGGSGNFQFQTAATGSDGVATSLVSNSLATRMTIARDGKVGIGTTSPSNTLHVVGSLCVKSATGACAGSTAGTIYATTQTVAAGDLAERLPTADASLAPGEVVVASRSGEVVDFQRSKRAHDEDAVGVVSTSPGVVLGSDTKLSRPIALAGRVPVNVTLEGGAIAIGDYLVPSSTPGKAMRAADAADRGILGVALSDYDGSAVPAKTWHDGVAHESGHQVMLLVHAGAGAQRAVSQLKAENQELRDRLGQLERDHAQTRAESAQLKAMMCAHEPDAPLCAPAGAAAGGMGPAD